MQFIRKISSSAYCNRIVFLSSHKIHSNIRNDAVMMTNGIPLYYETAGGGDNIALCLPGALGSAKSDFEPQLKNLASENLKIIAWDPPGYGNSRPPPRQFPLNFFNKDAVLAAQLMKNLGYSKYSLLGWSDGGITALIIAALFPKNIDKMVVWGANSYITDKDIALYEAIRDVSKWSERMRAPMEDMYGKEYFKAIWEGWIDVLMVIHKEKDGDICKSILPAIECPTLIVHGAKDAMVPNEHPHYIHKHVKDSELVIWEDGKHNLHLKFADRFNELVTNFFEQ